MVLFPFRLLSRLVGTSISDDNSLEPGGDIDTTTDATNTQSTAADATTGALVKSSESERKNLGRFRNGLIALGVVQLLIVVFGLSQPARGGVPSSLYQSLFLGGLIYASVPVLSGVALSRYPKGAYYVGMLHIGIAIATSLFTLPTGLVVLAVYLPVGYFGYTGRKALGDTHGTTSSTSRNGDYDALNNSQNTTESSTSGTSTATSTNSAIDSSSSSRTDNKGRSSQTSTATATPNTTPSTEDTSATEAAPEASASPTIGSSSTDGAATTQSSDAGTEPGTSDDSTREPDAVVELREALTAGTPATRRGAVEDLAERAHTDGVPDQDVVDALSDRLDDDDPTVRAAACDALGSLGAGSAKPALKERRIDSDREVSRAASRALRNLE
jgi:hypothetical protein